MEHGKFIRILIPYRNENVALKIQCIAAAISAALNLILIPRFSYIAAASVWVVVEVLLVIFEGILIDRKYKIVHITYFTKSAVKYFIAALVMSVFIIIIKLIVKYYIIVLIISIIVSPIIYFGTILAQKDELALSLVEQIITKIKK